MYRLTDYGSMLRDERRIDAYRRALAAVVSTGSVVLDLGSGLGTFSVLACKLGAARVYAIEAADVISVAEEIARVNGVAEKVRFVQAHASETELPERVDVIVSDLAGALPLFDEHIPTIVHARERFLKPGGTLIPQGDRLWCAPLSSAALHERIIGAWSSVPDVDFTPAAAMAIHAAHALPVEPEHLAAEPRCWAELDYATIASPNVRGVASWCMPADVELHGIALWFESILHGSIGSSSGPWSSGSVHATMVLPLAEPCRVRGGQTFGFSIEATLVAGHYVMTWQAGTSLQPGARQSTFLSEPRARESLSARQPGGVRADPTPHDTFRVSERVLCRRVGEEVLLLHLESGFYHVLNATGARVWALLECGEGVSRIAASFASEYDVDAERATGDVLAIVAELQDADLIVPDPE